MKNVEPGFLWYVPINGRMTEAVTRCTKGALKNFAKLTGKHLS